MRFGAKVSVMRISPTFRSLSNAASPGRQKPIPLEPPVSRTNRSASGAVILPFSAFPSLKRLEKAERARMPTRAEKRGCGWNDTQMTHQLLVSYHVLS